MSLYQIMNDGLYIGRYFKVPVFLHTSWLIMFTILCVFVPQFVLNWILLFGIVLLHEFGHIFAGQYFGQKAHSVTLSLLGGVASMQIPNNPRQEIIVALSGPLVNVLFAPFLWTLANNYPYFYILSYSNLVMLIFNLIPSFPMDGGRVLRALLSSWLGDRKKATLIAVRVSQVLCVGFAIFGITSFQLNLLFIGIFMAFVAQAELEAVRKERAESVAFPPNPRLERNVSSEVNESREILERVQRKIMDFDRRTKM
jgi:Zn-dependent protease